jgi:predicted transcriptional regulator
MALEDRLEDKEFRAELSQSRFFLAAQEGRLQILINALNLTPKYATIRAMEPGVEYTAQQLRKQVPKYYGLEKFVILNPHQYFENPCLTSNFFVSSEVGKINTSSKVHTYSLTAFGEFLQPVIDTFVPMIAKVGVELWDAVGGNSTRRIDALKDMLNKTKEGNKISIGEVDSSHAGVSHLARDLKRIGLVRYTHVPYKNSYVSFKPNRTKLLHLRNKNDAEIREIYNGVNPIFIRRIADYVTKLYRFSYQDIKEELNVPDRLIGFILPAMAKNGYLKREGPERRSALKLTKKGNNLAKVIQYLTDICADPIGAVRELDSETPLSAYNKMFQIYKRDRIRAGEAKMLVLKALESGCSNIAGIAKQVDLKIGTVTNSIQKLRQEGVVINDKNGNWKLVEQKKRQCSHTKTAENQ